MAKIDLFSSEWCNMIFADRNKSYGAYKLRKESEHRHTVAMFWVIVGVLLTFFIPDIVIKIALSKEDENIPIVQVKMISRIQQPVIKLKKVKLKKIDLSPREPDEDNKDIKSIIKFTAPVIKKDEEVSNADLQASQQAFDQGIKQEKVKKDTAQYAIPEQLTLDEADQHIKYETVESLPEFPGGETALMQYLSKNIKYPFWAQRYNMQGEVIVQFIVNTDGSLTDCRVVRYAGIYLDMEALRVIRAMPKWIPAKKNGKAVRARCVLPVVFRLN